MKAKKELDLTSGKIAPALLQFAIPFLFSSLLQALYGAVDLFVVGKYDDSAAVSAVASGSQYMQTITGIVLGISMGGTVLIGRHIGKKDDEGAAKAVGTLSILFTIIALILTPIMLATSGFATSLLHMPEEAFSAAKQYIFICSIGIPFIVGYNAVSGIFRGIGDSKTPLYFVMVACVVNIVFDFLLVGGMGLGAGGAAFATILAQAVSFIFALLFIKKKGFPFAFNKSYFKLDKISAKAILLVGSPLALQDALVNISFLIITVIANSMGLIASASVGVVEKIIIFAMLVPTSFASAVATMTAQNMGAKKPERAISSLKYGTLFSMIFGVCVWIYCQIAPETLATIFSSDPQVIESAGIYLKSYTLDCILVGFIFCANSYFNGCGKSIISFIHSMIATFGFRIPIAYFMSKAFPASLFPMGLAAPLGSLVSVFICIGYFLWMKKQSAKNIEPNIPLNEEVEMS